MRVILRRGVVEKFAHPSIYLRIPIYIYIYIYIDKSILWDSKTITFFFFINGIENLVAEHQAIKV
jgi:hypothetical protein